VLDGDADENPVQLQLAVDSPPGNDDLASAKRIVGSTALLQSTTIGATRETSEPQIGALPFGHSVWFNWAAPNSGRAQLLSLTNIFTDFAVFTGSNMSSLRLLASSAQAR